MKHNVSFVTIQFGTWCHRAGNLLVHDRVYTNKGKWTPLCITSFRHVGMYPEGY